MVVFQDRIKKAKERFEAQVRAFQERNPFFITTEEIGSGLWYMECRNCKAVYQYPNFIYLEDGLVCPHCEYEGEEADNGATEIPFNGEPVEPKSDNQFHGPYDYGC